MEQIELTVTQIDQMLAGPELDAFVAEKVMGAAKPTDQAHGAHIEPIFHGPYWSCAPEYAKGDICEWQPMPFSTDIRAA